MFSIFRTMRFFTTKFEGLILFGTSSLFIALPSFLISLYSRNSSSFPVFEQTTVLFNEKFWIYFLEFSRSKTLGLFHWPSLTVDSPIYIERLFPRSLDFLLTLFFHDYFLADSLILFLICIFLFSFLNPYLVNNNVHRYAFPVVIAFASFYNFRINLIWRSFCTYFFF